MSDEQERAEKDEARKLRKHHATYLGMALFVFALSLFLSNDGERVVLPFLGTPLPPLCPLKSWSGLECPGCGLTRSWVALAHLQVAESWAYHRLGIALFVANAYQLIYRPMMIIKGGETPTKLSKIHTWIGRALIAALISNWAWKTFVNV